MRSRSAGWWTSTWSATRSGSRRASTSWATWARESPEDWSEEKTRNETDLIRTRIKKTIEQELADDPYAQQVFSELLKQAIAEAEALFDHPLKQYALFKAFEEKVQARCR